MGNSLHNKIYLGRRSPFGARRLLALGVAFSVAASVALAWVGLAAWR